MVTELRPGEGGTTNTDGGTTGDPSARQRFSILIADDDRGTRETLGEMLAARGFRVMLAADGGEAVELVQVDLVHLVLFDMHMPRLTGLEAFAVIRQTLDRILPAVLMTADANNDLIRQAFAAQVYSVIPKPVNGNVVFHTLERALAKVYGPRPAETAHAGEARDAGTNRPRPAETAHAGEARNAGTNRPRPAADEARDAGVNRLPPAAEPGDAGVNRLRPTEKVAENPTEPKPPASNE